MTNNGMMAAVRARIVLPGHADMQARVDVRELSLAARVSRTAMMAGVWAAVTTAVFLVTLFDPFMTSLPALVGAMAVYHGWRGRFQVRSFHGGCPRCGADIQLKPNTRVSTPHSLVCYACHHEPKLVFIRG